MKAKNALVIGIRDEESICYAIANELKRAGYTIYATYQDETTLDSVERVAEAMGIERLYAYDARKDEDLASFLAAIREEDVLFDVLVHGISYSTASGAKLSMPLVDLTWNEFTDAVRVGAFSLAELSGGLLDSLKEDASILTVSLRWSKVAVPGYNVVCAVKAGLESMIRGLADSLGRAKQIRVNGISPGFVPTYSLAKVGNSLDILEEEKSKSPLKTGVRKQDIASLAVSILENRSITAMVYQVDAGVSAIGR